MIAPHVSVLLDEVIQNLAVGPGDVEHWRETVLRIP